MKARMFLDILPGLGPTGVLMATTMPSFKPEGVVRLSFVVDIPDDLYPGADHYLPDVEGVMREDTGKSLDLNQPPRLNPIGRMQGKVWT
jgi:hypothetical protein